MPQLSEPELTTLAAAALASAQSTSAAVRGSTELAGDQVNLWHQY